MKIYIVHDYRVNQSELVGEIRKVFNNYKDAVNWKRMFDANCEIEEAELEE